MQKLIYPILACLLPSAAFAAAPMEGSMPLAGVAATPAGYVEMCRRHPAECASDAAPSAQDIAEQRQASQAQWAAIFGSRAPRASESPSSVAVTPVIGRPRIAMASHSWTLSPSDYNPLSSRGTEPRPFWTSGNTSSAAFWRAPQPRPANTPTLPPQPATVAEATPVVEAYADMRALRTINARVNRSIRRATDSDTFGREDFWAVPQDGATSGDCEDYVLAKRDALLEAGVSPAALSIALVRTRQGEMHAVLLVATESGEVVLDNLSPWILTWQEAPYSWVTRQEPGSGRWMRVGRTA